MFLSRNKGPKVILAKIFKINSNQLFSSKRTTLCFQFLILSLLMISLVKLLKYENFQSCVKLYDF